MAITARKGLKEQFIPSKLRPGEFAVATDTGNAWYCYSFGKVMMIATADDIGIVRTEADSYKEAQELIIRQISTKADNAVSEIAGVNDSLTQISKKVDTLQMLFGDKVDDAYVEDGYLYMTANNEIVVGPLGPFSGSGGGGGTGGNNATLTVTNTSGWLSKTVAVGASCMISFLWYSTEDELSTGNGSLKITVNGLVKASMDIQQGSMSIDVSKYLGIGGNAVKVNVSDVYGNNRTINFSISTISLSLASTFDASVPYTGAIAFTYIPTGSVLKTTHIILDGVEIGTAQTSVSGRQQSFTIPSQTHGAHKLEVYFTAEIDGQTVESNKLYYELICIDRLSTEPIIVSEFKETEVMQYTSITIPYAVYDPLSMTADVGITVNGSVVSQQTVDRAQQLYTYRADKVGILTIEIISGTAKKTLSLNVKQSDVTIEAESNDLSLYLSSHGRSNNEAEPGKWEYQNIKTIFSGFNYKSDGWQMDNDNITVLRVAGEAKLTIPLQVFGQDFRITGKTIEIEFATRNVMDYDAVIMSCFTGNRGFQLTAQKALLKSEQSEIFTQYKENEHVRIAFVVEKRVENRLIYCYINGIMSGAIQYPQDDDFAQQKPVGISIGSKDCAVDLYCIRVYDNDLTRHQILNNWIADTQVVSDMLIRYQRNNVYDGYGQVVIPQLPKDLPYLVLEGLDLPQYKGDKKILSGYYTDPSNPQKNFTFTDAQADVQGTSSQYYARKNYKVKFKGGFVGGDGNTISTYAIRSGAIPTDTFTFKADVASSEGANNVELVRLYNDTCPYKTPAQMENSAVRQGIDGFPIVIFWYNGEDTIFLGKYNFNNDKGTPEVFGFSGDDESWDVRNNTSDRVLWKSDDYSGTDWMSDFESRYPEDFTDPTKLQALAAWLASTDQSKATGETLPASVTYNGVAHTSDTVAYRLAKFKAELSNHMETQAVLFYYLFTELFLMVDSRAKNMFPTFIGGSKWFSLPYDFDTAIGINNEGTLAFSYNLEDIDLTETGADVYNGQQSVLWINTRQAFKDEIKEMYQNLRSAGKLSYADTEQRFEDHQSKWPEAIFNEDAYYKYLAPLIEENSAAYLSMLQGSKAEQRKWWLYNRFRYLDSKYNAGDSLTDTITLRGYAKANVTITPYADIYTTIKYGSYLVQKRATRNQSYLLECPLDNVNDTEIYIYSASQLSSVGDLSGLMVGYAEFSKASRLQSLKIGDSKSSYQNTNLKELYLGNNTLLRMLDVRNCPNLTQAVDISGCSNIEYVYFDGTAITGLRLPNGGILKTLRLPSTVTNLTIRNQTAITELSMPSYENISTLWLENVSEVVDSKSMLKAILPNSRVRIIGFEWDAQDANEITELLDIVDSMRGMDENGNNMQQVQLKGTINVEFITGSDLATIRARYPDVNVIYSQIACCVYFYSWDGSKLLYTDTVVNGDKAIYRGETPTRDPDNKYSYSFSGGWAEVPYGNAKSGILSNITEDRKVYAAFISGIRKYTVYFYNGQTLLQAIPNVSYGGGTSYTGSTPVPPNDGSGKYFERWEPEPHDIRGDTSCYAQFGSFYETKEIEDSWEEIIAAIDNGSYRAKYNIGNYKPLVLSDGNTVNMQIAAKDKDILADESGSAAITWIEKEILFKHQMNPKLVVEEDGTYREGTGCVGGWKQSDLRVYLKETIKPLIPTLVRERIVNVSKTQLARNVIGEGYTQSTTEDVWIPSLEEMSGETCVYENLFPDNQSRIRWREQRKNEWYARSSYDLPGSFPNSEVLMWVYVSQTGDTRGGYSSTGELGVCLSFCM